MQQNSAPLNDSLVERMASLHSNQMHSEDENMQAVTLQPRHLAENSDSHNTSIASRGNMKSKDHVRKESSVEQGSTRNY